VKGRSVRCIPPVIAQYQYRLDPSFTEEYEHILIRDSKILQNLIHFMLESTLHRALPGPEVNPVPTATIRTKIVLLQAVT
jgi:hypothetical protein